MEAINRALRLNNKNVNALARQYNRVQRENWNAMDEEFRRNGRSRRWDDIRIGGYSTTAVISEYMRRKLRRM